MTTAVLFTDRPGFEPLWRPACEQHGLAVSVRRPEALAEAAGPSVALVFDVGAALYSESEDELLASVALAKAKGAVPVISLELDRSAADFDDLVEDLCEGLVARAPGDVVRVAALLARRLDSGRAGRFEFVTVAPGSDELLAILGDGRCHLLPRPFDAKDDQSDVVQIELAEDAKSAQIRLESGALVDLGLAALAPSASSAMNGTSAAHGLPIDGPRLGARLRELRKAAGLTQAELARRTGIHRPNIARVEAGRHTPSLETLARLASAIGVPTTAVLVED